MSREREIHVIKMIALQQPALVRRFAWLTEMLCIDWPNTDESMNEVADWQVSLISTSVYGGSGRQEHTACCY